MTVVCLAPPSAALCVVAAELLGRERIQPRNVRTEFAHPTGREARAWLVGYYRSKVEQTAPLPRELSLDGAPEGHDPAAGDIG